MQLRSRRPKGCLNWSRLGGLGKVVCAWGWAGGGNGDKLVLRTRPRGGRMTGRPGGLGRGMCVSMAGLGSGQRGTGSH